MHPAHRYMETIIAKKGAGRGASFSLCFDKGVDEEYGIVYKVVWPGYYGMCYFNVFGRRQDPMSLCSCDTWVY